MCACAQHLHVWHLILHIIKIYLRYVNIDRMQILSVYYRYSKWNKRHINSNFSFGYLIVLKKDRSTLKSSVPLLRDFNKWKKIDSKI